MGCQYKNYFNCNQPLTHTKNNYKNSKVANAESTTNKADTSTNVNLKQRSANLVSPEV